MHKLAVVRNYMKYYTYCISFFVFSLLVQTAKATTAFSDSTNPAISIEGLVEGSVYTITMNSESCYSSGKIEIFVAMEDDSYVLWGNRYSEINYKKEYQQYAKILLTKAQVDSIRSFEKEMFFLIKKEKKSGGDFCTSQSHVQISLLKRSISYIEDSCEPTLFSKIKGLLVVVKNSGI